MRREIEEVALRAGLKFIVNVVQDKTGRLAGVFAGDPIKAHRQGCELAQRIYGVNIKARADIVITEAFPAELELWQATKALQAADMVVNPGGVIIFLAACPEGISQSHGQLILKYGFRPLAEVEKLVARKEITDLNAASYLARVGNIVSRARVILVSRGINTGRSTGPWPGNRCYTAGRLGYGYKAGWTKNAGSSFTPRQRNPTGISKYRQGMQVVAINVKGVLRGDLDKVVVAKEIS